MKTGHIPISFLVFAAVVVANPCISVNSQVIEKQVRPLSQVDPWAGKPVIDGKHANDMVMGRLFNAPKLGEKAPPAVLIEGLTGKVINLSQLHSRKPVVLFLQAGPVFVPRNRLLR